MRSCAQTPRVEMKGKKGGKERNEGRGRKGMTEEKVGMKRKGDFDPLGVIQVTPHCEK